MSEFSEIRRQFPILNHKNLVYLDTAASAQKPTVVIDALADFLKNDFSNIHRGAHFLGDRATEKYENARKKIANFINATSSREIVFGKNATEMINLVAHSLEDGGFFEEHDTILLTEMEHHANLVPWIQLAKRKNLQLDFLRIDKNRELILDEDKIKNAKMIALTHVSNVLGTKNPVEKICALAKKYRTRSLVDGCQSVPHFSVDMQKIGCDFFVFSSHKIYGPSGVGILFGRKEILREMPPFLGGGEMIRSVSFRDFVAGEIPNRFEAGTPPIEGVVGCGAAIDFLSEMGMDKIAEHDAEISDFARNILSKIPEITILSHKQASGLVTFSLKKGQNYDLSDFLSDRGICVRIGHHCAESLHELLGVKTSIRASFGIYTEKREIELLEKAIRDFCSEP